MKSGTDTVCMVPPELFLIALPLASAVVVVFGDD